MSALVWALEKTLALLKITVSHPPLLPGDPSIPSFPAAWSSNEDCGYDLENPMHEIYLK